MRGKRFKSLLIGGLLIIFPALLVIAAFEIYLRLTGTYVTKPKTGQPIAFLERDAELLLIHTPGGKRITPNARVVIKNHRISGRDILLETNSLGFRDHEIASPKKRNELRVLILGDSITWGDYLEAGETYVEKVEKYLSEALKGYSVEVINAGLADIGLKEELDILAEKGLALEPDLVVLAFYVNDSRPPWGFSGELGSRGWLRRHSLLAETIYQNLKLRQWIREQGEERLGWTSMVTRLDWVNDRQNFLRFAAMARYDWGAAWQSDSWEVIDRGLADLQALSRKHNFRVAVVVFPVAYQAYTRFVEDTPQRIMREKTLRLGFYYLDLLPFLREYRMKEKNIYYDWCHPTPKTNDLIGGIIAGFLDKILANKLVLAH